jgi:enamine deaminase RidA (YjgF/YER057c/UK114 family)
VARLVFVGGQIGWNGSNSSRATTSSPDPAGAAERACGALLRRRRPEHMVRMTWYITDRDEYNARLRELGGVYREVMGKHFPAMTCVEVSRLVEAPAPRWKSRSRPWCRKP